MQTMLAEWREETGARMPTANPKHDPARAAEWWNRRTNKPLDVEAMARHYESQKAKNAAKDEH
jgi:hypothetical protein